MNVKHFGQIPTDKNTIKEQLLLNMQSIVRDLVYVISEYNKGDAWIARLLGVSTRLHFLSLLVYDGKKWDAEEYKEEFTNYLESIEELDDYLKVNKSIGEKNEILDIYKALSDYISLWLSVDYEVLSVLEFLKLIHLTIINKGVLSFDKGSIFPIGFWDEEALRGEI